MTREHLLEAMGLLDDDLIAQAEEPAQARPAAPARRRWAALAACLALVLVVSVVGKNLYGGPGDSTSPSTSSGAPAASNQGSGDPSAGGSAPSTGWGQRRTGGSWGTGAGDWAAGPDRPPRRQRDRSDISIPPMRSF